MYLGKHPSEEADMSAPLTLVSTARVRAGHEAEEIRQCSYYMGAVLGRVASKVPFRTLVWEART
jgi:hypothetical protein